MSLVEEVGFDQSFSFIYSRRPGTPPHPCPTSAARGEAGAARALQARIDAQGACHQPRHVGSVQRVLVERPAKKDARQLAAHRNNRW